MIFLNARLKPLTDDVDDTYHVKCSSGKTQGPGIQVAAIKSKQYIVSEKVNLRNATP